MRHGSRPRVRRGGAAVRLTAALALLLGSLGIGLTLTSPASGADSGGKTTFTVALLNEADSFNPFLGIEAESYEMWALTYDYMISYRMSDMAPQPGLAKSWDTSDDGLTWTFHIRDGVSWSDGKPLTAADIAYTYNRVLDGGPEAASWSSYLKSVTSITAPDPQTVVLELKKPNAVLPLLPIPIIPEHVWKNVSEDEVKSYAAEPTDGKPVVGSGPFRFVEGTAGGSTYRFEANPDYWAGAPHVDEVVFKVYKSNDPAVQALKTGEVDFVEGINALQVKSLQGEDGITAINGDSPSFDEIAFNAGSVDLKTGKPIGDVNPAVMDPKFRWALNWAVDRDQIVSKVYQGAGKPGTTIVPPAYEYHWEPTGADAVSFDLDKADQLLTEAGYDKDADGNRLMPDGSPMEPLRMYARAESPTSVDTMDFFKEWLDELGIPSEITAVESSKLTNIILDGTFDVFQWGWYVEPDPDSILSYMTCGQRGNWSDSWYCNHAYDKLYAEQNANTDHASRVDQINQMQKMLWEDSPYLVTAYSAISEAARTDTFACFVPQPNPGGVWLLQYGAYNYLHIRPADEAGDCGGVEGAVLPTGSAAQGAAPSDDGGGSTGLVVGGVVVVLLLAGGVVLALRRRGTVAERE